MYAYKWVKCPKDIRFLFNKKKKKITKANQNNKQTHKQVLNNVLDFIFKLL
jgi:hypothetical protein